jgi:NodT family efflux transporter outer membrane factor (OMF) lipoprotein
MFGKVRWIEIASIALVTAGCAGMRGLEPRGQPASPDELRADKALGAAPIDAAGWPGADWWTRFLDPQLNRLEEEALAASPSLDAAAARIDKAVAVAGLARAATRPGLDVLFEGTDQRYSEHDVAPSALAGRWDTASRLATDFRYELDFWHKNRAAFEAALSRVDAARVDAFAARLAVSVAVAHAYVELARLHDALDVATATLEQREHILDLTRQRVAAGLDTQVELEQAEGALPAARVAIEDLGEALDLTRHQLAALLGRGPDRGLEIERPQLGVAAETPALPTRLPAELLGRRPDVIAGRQRIEAAARDIVVAKADFFPRIDLLAFAGFKSIGLSNLTDAGSRVAGAGPALHLPLFDRKAIESRLAARNADYDAAVDEYNATLIDALRDTSDQITSVRSVARQRDDQRLALDAARHAYDLALMRYREGLGTYLTVLSVETEVLKQQKQSVDLRARDYATRIGLMRALGGGFDNAAPPASASGTQANTRKSS